MSTLIGVYYKTPAHEARAHSAFRRRLVAQGTRGFIGFVSLSGAVCAWPAA